MNLLEKPFTVDEVYSVLCSVKGDKTPGPDGLLMLVYQLALPILKKEILSAFNEFRSNSFFNWRLNSTFITLIPKIGGEKEIQDY